MIHNSGGGVVPLYTSDMEADIFPWESDIKGKCEMKWKYILSGLLPLKNSWIGKQGKDNANCVFI